MLNLLTSGARVRINEKDPGTRYTYHTSLLQGFYRGICKLVITTLLLKECYSSIHVLVMPTLATYQINEPTVNVGLDGFNIQDKK